MLNRYTIDGMTVLAVSEIEATRIARGQDASDAYEAEEGPATVRSAPSGVLVHARPIQVMVAC